MSFRAFIAFSMLILGVCALGHAAQAAETSPEVAKDLYLARCGACHLEGGGGTNMLAKRLGKEKALLESRADLLPLYVRTVVRQGVGSMPWFTRVELRDAELTAIENYLAAPVTD